VNFTDLFGLAKEGDYEDSNEDSEEISIWSWPSGGDGGAAAASLLGAFRSLARQSDDRMVERAADVRDFPALSSSSLSSSLSRSE
jgi:hypothetical protein